MVIPIHNQIEQSELFSILRSMPKGAALHTHDLSILASELLTERLDVLNTWWNKHLSLEGCPVFDSELKDQFFQTKEKTS